MSLWEIWIFLKRVKKTFRMICWDFFQFHEEALQKYKQDVNEMYIQFASVTTATHYKEIEEKKAKFIKQQEQRQVIHVEENI